LNFLKGFFGKGEYSRGNPILNENLNTTRSDEINISITSDDIVSTMSVDKYKISMFKFILL
jgi:hypothetical protein